MTWHSTHSAWRTAACRYARDDSALRKEFLALFFILLLLSALSGCAESAGKEAAIEAYFCPREQCEQRLVQLFNGAQESIHVAVYSFTNDDIAAALAEAHGRGVEVLVLLDAGQAESSYSDDEALEAAGIPVRRLGMERGVMHNKFAIVDTKVVATGSFNYSKNAALYNRENLVFIHGTEAAEEFESEFRRLWDAA